MDIKLVDIEDGETIIRRPDFDVHNLNFWLLLICQQHEVYKNCISFVAGLLLPVVATAYTMKGTAVHHYRDIVSTNIQYSAINWAKCMDPGYQSASQYMYGMH